ncbi:flagellar hook-associated protein FlgK [Conyzicola nivalis]|uniref:Flagellar hook-associated protein 1 n=1 Tax=Conyzicola nivalis TaxID=1477021 RepID=A0A916SNZ8_9MICO|nr:flagellar hook-associated protein FlgK [Conyzicola nivalis]GGB10288.1 flagellar hook-associated protein FlgK [Conyzicola nivalis]
MSTFSGLNTAYSGLVAARHGIDVSGQNIVNVNTTGYTRQRAVQEAAGSLAQVGRLTGQVKVGQGVAVTTIQRLGDSFLDAKVRSTTASSGYWGVRANVLSTLQTSLHEPGDNGISKQLSNVWAAWSDMGNKAGDPAAAAVLLQQSGALVTQISDGYTAVTNQWDQLRTETSGLVTELNDAAGQVAALNGLIRSTLNAGGSANEYIDQRNALTTTMATLSGATLRNLPDGTAEVLLGGNALVSGDRSYALEVTGTTALAGAVGDPVKLNWVGRPDVPVSVDGGEIAGALSSLSGANAAGTGGALAEAAADYNEFATFLATKINAVHNGGVRADGSPGGDFFALPLTGPAALGLTVIPTDVKGIAYAAPGAGGKDGSIAAAIAKIKSDKDAPDTMWSAIVTSIGTAAKSGMQQSNLADLSTKAAVGNQLANSAVDMDEEQLNLQMFQTAYNGAARVLTAVDEMLDTLINRTGLVGR